MLEYDPMMAPDRTEWLEADENDRIHAVLQFHDGDLNDDKRDRAHAAIHAAVETQIAMGDETPTEATLHRLMRQGLSRHDAIHAIGNVLTVMMWEMATSSTPYSDKKYAAALKRLTAAKWRRGEH
jgi:hypothetical protein